MLALGQGGQLPNPAAANQKNDTNENHRTQHF